LISFKLLSLIYFLSIKSDFRFTVTEYYENITEDLDIFNLPYERKYLYLSIGVPILNNTL